MHDVYIRSYRPARIARDFLAAGLTLLAAFIIAAALFGCAGPISGVQSTVTDVSDALLTDLAKIGNTAQTDLAKADAVALAATPPDQDGHVCLTTVGGVLGDIQKVNAAAGGAGAGVFTVGEMASLFQPGSIQYNTEKQKLVSGCAAKAQDVLGAAGVLAAGGVVGAIAAGQMLPVLAAVP